MDIVIDWKTRDVDEIKEVVKIVSEIEKEYNCNCTLSIVKIILPFSDSHKNAQK